MKLQLRFFFSFLTKLLNNQKFSSIPPLLENCLIVNDPEQQGNILNQPFAKKSTVPGSDDEVPLLEHSGKLFGLIENPISFSL